MGQLRQLDATGTPTDYSDIILNNVAQQEVVLDKSSPVVNNIRLLLIFDISGANIDHCGNRFYQRHIATHRWRRVSILGWMATMDNLKFWRLP